MVILNQNPDKLLLLTISRLGNCWSSQWSNAETPGYQLFSRRSYRVTGRWRVWFTGIWTGLTWIEASELFQTLIMRQILYWGSLPALWSVPYIFLAQMRTCSGPVVVSIAGTNLSNAYRNFPVTGFDLFIYSWVTRSTSNQETHGQTPEKMADPEAPTLTRATSLSLSQSALTLLHTMPSLCRLLRIVSSSYFLREKQTGDTSNISKSQTNIFYNVHNAPPKIWASKNMLCTWFLIQPGLLWLTGRKSLSTDPQSV